MTHRSTTQGLEAREHRGPVALRSLAALVRVDLKLYVREPVAAFFTVVFPIMLVLLFGAIYGNEPEAMFDGRGSMDVSMPAYTALIVATVGLLGVAITTSGYREAGVLRRYRLTPMRPAIYIAADVAANLVMTLVGIGGVVLVGWLAYRVQFDGQVVGVLLAVLLAGGAMFAMGYLIAALAPNARTAQVIGMVVLYPMLFLSGAAIPLEVLPASVHRISDFLPLTYAVRLLRGVWVGDGWTTLLPEAGVLAAVLVVCTLMAARLFRWE